MNIFSPDQLKNWGIEDYGLTDEAIPLTREHYNHWVDNGDHLPLTYLEGERQQKRQSLTEHWPDCQSAIVFLFSYHEGHQYLQSLYQNDPQWNGLKLASYTLGFEGMDYHHVVRERLIEIGESLKIDNSSLVYKLTLDTHPVLERDLAMRAGLGWFGKNSMMINRSQGSFFIIGSLLLNQSLKSLNVSERRTLETDHCGQCTKCIVACPTQAIDPETRTIKAQDCISTFTIEQFKLDTIPSQKMTLKDGFIFGCDICQDVCPWNVRVDRLKNVVLKKFDNETQTKIINFFLRRNPTDLADDMESMTEGFFKRMFKNTTFERSGRRGLLKNIKFYLLESFK
jgi:epoxyqueuosine reductase